MLLDKCLFSLYIQGNETGYNNQWKGYCEFIFRGTRLSGTPEWITKASKTIAPIIPKSV